VVRVRLSPDGPVQVGEAVTLSVDVLVPTWFLGAPKFRDLSVPNALVEFQPRSGMNLSEEIEGETWAGLSKAYLIVPLAPGPVAVPPVTVDVRYAGPDARPREAAVRSQGARTSARVPPEAGHLQHFLPTRSLTLTQTFEPAGRPRLLVGDALTRSVRVEVLGTTAMLVPPLDPEPLPGSSVYPGQPEVVDRPGQRGEPRRGTRAESVTYVFEQPGVYALPDLHLPWWNLQTQAVEWASTPGLTVEVLGVGAASAEAPGLATTRSLHPDTEGLLVLLGFLGFLFALSHSHRLEAWWAARQARWERSEPAAYARFRGAAATADARAVHRALLAWRDVAAGDGGRETLAAFAAHWGDSALVRQVQALEAAAFGRGATWDRTRLAEEVARARAAQRRSKPAGPAESLPPLNPR
jgi:hypothetical protein